CVAAPHLKQSFEDREQEFFAVLCPFFVFAGLMQKFSSRKRLFYVSIINALTPKIANPAKKEIF
ncbi:MAG TPA: hypothetical protein PL074_07085, partial [Thermoflexales bacterium]|nr:hypothetical protein [Thermoflexales bacterium]